ncbi:MAG: HAD-IA family hydrolase [Pseudomonadota bacterium]
MRERPNTTLPERIEAVVFDLDGTLVDTLSDIDAHANAMLARLGRRALAREETASFIGEGLRVFVERSLSATAAAGLAAIGLDEAMGVFDAEANRLGYAADPFDGAEQLLARIGAAGVPMAVCTNKIEAGAHTLLATRGLAHHFAAVIGGDTLAFLKPDPRPLLAAVEAVGRPETTLYVGDSGTDARTSEAAGIAFALHTEGYRREPLEALPAAITFAQFAALETAIAGRLSRPPSGA